MQGGGSGSGINWSEIGYEEEPSVIKDGYDYAVEIKNNWVPATNLANKFNSDYNLIFMPLVDTSIATNTQNMFGSCISLIQIPQLNTNNVNNMSNMFYGCRSLTTIPQLDTTNLIVMSNMFYNCYSLITIPQLNTSIVTNMQSIFSGCNSLVSIPQLNTNKLTNMQNMFTNCNSLSDESLNNILAMCINATSYKGTKTLKYIGINSKQATTCQTLSNYQAFLDAGWTTGY